MEQQALSSVTIRPITAADDPFIAKSSAQILSSIT